METSNVGAYAALHQTRAYGTTAIKMRRFIEPWVVAAAPETLLDYGAGQGCFGETLRAPSLRVRDAYDPAIPAIAAVPRAAYDLIVCVDVLEHLEPIEVPAVLAHMRSLSPRAILVVDTKPARAVLPDGRNAHTTLRPPGWWREAVGAAFGTAVPVPVLRRGRFGLKTFRSPPQDWVRFGASLARAEAARAWHRTRRLGAGGAG